MEYPRIGVGHAEQLGGIFSLLRDPGGKHTTHTGAIPSKFVDLHNKDNTARWGRKLIDRLGIPKSLITPWNAHGAYDEKRTVKSLQENKLLCQKLIDTAKPSVVIAQGRQAQRMLCFLRLTEAVYLVPHPSIRGRNAYGGEGAKDIEAAFVAAFRLVKLGTNTGKLGSVYLHHTD